MPDIRGDTCKKNLILNILYFKMFYALFKGIFYEALFTKICMLVLCMTFNSPLFSAKLLTGDPNAAAGDTFSFNISRWAFDSVNGYFYMGASTAPGAGAESYAIAVAQLSSGVVAPNAPAQAYVNGVLGVHPFYNINPTSLGLSGTNLLAVPAGATTNLYCYTSAPGSTISTLLKNDVLKDATGADSTNGIQSSNNRYLISGTGSTVFAAVAPNGGGNNFGELNSGIAVFATSASGLVQQAAISGDAVVKSVPFQVSTAQLKINTDLDNVASSSTGLDMFWDQQLQRLYMVTRILAANTGNADGGLGIMMGYLTVENGQQKLNFVKMAPDAAFTNGNQIIGGIHGGVGQVRVVLDKVRVMHTSTGLSYLIVNGDSANGVPANTTRKVFALPLVDKNSSPTDNSWVTDAGHGVLAAVTSAPTTNWSTGIFGKATAEFFYSRTFTTPATAAGHLYSNTIAATNPACVGGGLAGADIADMVVMRDTVFVTRSTQNDAPSGIYYSQALFNADGTIKGWTNWARAFVPAANTEVFSGMAYLSSKGNLTFLENNNGGGVRIVKSQQWSDGALDGLSGGTAANSAVGLVAQLKQEFPESNGGILGSFIFPSTTPGFNQTALISLVVGIFTGNKKIVVAQLGAGATVGVVDMIIPQVGDFAAQKITLNNGPYPGGDATMISITTDALTVLDKITSATIINDVGLGGYLLLGGTGGVAALRTNPTKQGWGDVLQKNFANFPTTSGFDLMSNFTNVIKLWSSGSNIYVLTPTSLSRIASGALNTDPGTAIVTTVIATPAGMGLPSWATFADFVASGTLGVLATSEGLYRISNGSSIATATNVAASWTKVDLPGGYNSATRLIPVSSTELENNFAGTASGMLYVMSGSVGKKTSAVYRFSVADATAGVNNGTLQLIQDQLLKNTTGPMAYLGDYRNFFYSDGALVTTTRSKTATENPIFQSFPLSYSTNNKIFSKSGVTNIDLGIGSSDSINMPVRNTAQGGWMMTGSFGLVVNE